MGISLGCRGRGVGVRSLSGPDSSICRYAVRIAAAVILTGADAVARGAVGVLIAGAAVSEAQLIDL